MGNDLTAPLTISPAEGSWETIAEITADKDVDDQVEFLSLITPDYDWYRVRYYNVVPGTDGGYLGFVISTDNGQTFEFTNYDYVNIESINSLVSPSGSGNFPRIYILRG